MITQDLSYSGVYVFVRERPFDTWAAALDLYRQLPRLNILPGHGAPGGSELSNKFQHYLSAIFLRYFRSGFGLAANRNANYPRASCAGNELPCLPDHNTPLCPGSGTQSARWCGEDQDL